MLLLKDGYSKTGMPTGFSGKATSLFRGVMVSDGLNVAKTGDDGTFVLPGHEKARFIFVTTPSGYMAADGYYKRIAPQTEQYGFPLLPYDAGIGKDGSHTFIQVTDTEISGPDGHDAWIENIRECAAERNAAFIVHTGDICYEKGLKSHIGLMNIGNMGIPVYYGIGNHDLVKGSYGEELFESIYGPTWYSFDVAGTHYVMLPMLSGDFKPSYTQDDVAAWLANDLGNIAPGTPVVVFSHNILTYGNSFLYKGADGRGVDLNSHNLKAWIYGHIHTNQVRRQGDVLTFCTSPSDKGGVDHSMGGFRIFTVGKDGGVTSELRYPYLYHKVRIASPVGTAASTQLTLNAYNTTADVVAVTASCHAEGKTVFRNLRLTRCTDWSWNALMPLKEKHAGRKMTVKAEVRFSDGHKEETESEFVYIPSLSAVSLTDDWTNLRGNASHNAGASAIDGPLHLSWVTNVGANIFMTSPIIHDGTVYTATTDENMAGQSFICALNGGDGGILWKYPTRGSVKNTIAIERGLVFAQDICGWLYAVDAADGELKWEKKLPVNEGRPPLADGLATNDGVVYAGSGKGLSAWDAVSGRMLWKNEDWKQREGTTSTLAVGDGVVVGGVHYRGILVMTGVKPEDAGGNEHIIVSEDGKAAVWAGTIDDLWQLGKPLGHGGPWKDAEVKAGVPSDPYLIGFYDRKELVLSHDSDVDVVFTIEVDPTGNGDWMQYKSVAVGVGKAWTYDFPEAFQARWIRFSTDADTRATAWLEYQ